MSATLYLLRQPPDFISSSLFRASDTDMDIVFIEQSPSSLPASVKGSVVSPKGMTVAFSHPMMTYEELVEKIFSSQHIIVV
jgi:hypothetical protein